MLKSIISLYQEKRYLIVLSLEVLVLLFVSLLALIIDCLQIIVSAALSAFFLTCLFILISYFIKAYIRKPNLKLFTVFTISVSVLGFFIYFIFVFGRNMEYVSDHTCYFNQQIEMQNLFANSHLKGLYAIVKSCWFSDYSYFINVFLELPFLIFPKTNEAYIIIYYFAFIVPVFVLANVLIFNIIDNHAILYAKSFAVLCNITILFFPLIHFASLLGMPDIFGLFFVFAIIILLMNYDFRIFRLKRVLLLSGLTIALVITRRWYIFWIIGFIPCVIVISFCFYYFLYLQNRKEIIINYLKSCLVVGFVVVVFMFPFFYHTFFDRNYCKDYSAWYLGGFPYELKNQVGYLGLLMLVLILFGIVYGLYNKMNRIITISCVFGGLITLWSFTLIQNMGKHQSLCMVPYYIIALFVLYCFIDRIKNNILRFSLISIVLLIFSMNIFSSVFGVVDDIDGIFLTTKYAISTRFTWKWLS